MKILSILGLILIFRTAQPEKQNKDVMLNREIRSQNDVNAILSRVKFDCRARKVAYYADKDFGCEVFHFCDKFERRFTYKCRSGKKFDQKSNSCTLEYIPNCYTKTSEAEQEHEVIQNAARNIKTRSTDHSSRDPRGRVHFNNDFQYKYENNPDYQRRALRQPENIGKALGNSFQIGDGGIDTLSAFAALAQNNDLGGNDNLDKFKFERERQIDRSFHDSPIHSTGRGRVRFGDENLHVPLHHRETFNQFPGAPSERHTPSFNFRHPDPRERVHRIPVENRIPNTHLQDSTINRNFQTRNFQTTHNEPNVHSFQLPLQSNHRPPPRSHFSFTPPGSASLPTRSSIAHHEPEFRQTLPHRFNPFGEPNSNLHIPPNNIPRPPPRVFAGPHIFNQGFSPSPPHQNHFPIHDKHRPLYKDEPIRPVNPHHPSAIVRNPKPEFAHVPAVHNNHDEFYYDYDEENSEPGNDEYYYYYDEDDTDYNEQRKTTPEKEEKRAPIAPHKDPEPEKEIKLAKTIPKPPLIPVTTPRTVRIPFKSQNKNIQRQNSQVNQKTKDENPPDEKTKQTTTRPSFRIPTSRRTRLGQGNTQRGSKTPKVGTEKTKEPNAVSRRRLASSSKDNLRNKLRKVAEERRPSAQRESSIADESKDDESRPPRPQRRRPSRPSRITQFFKPRIPAINNKADSRLNVDNIMPEEPTRKEPESVKDEKIPKSIDGGQTTEENSDKEDTAPKPKMIEDELPIGDGNIKEAPTPRPSNPNVRAKFNRFLKNRKNRLASLRIPTRRTQRTQKKIDNNGESIKKSETKNVDEVKDVGEPVLQKPSDSIPRQDEEIRKKRLTNDLEYSPSIRMIKKEEIPIDPRRTRKETVEPTKTLRYLLNRNSEDSFHDQELVKFSPEKLKDEELRFPKIGSSIEKKRVKYVPKITNHRIVKKPNFKQFVRMSPNNPAADNDNENKSIGSHVTRDYEPSVITAPPQQFAVKVSTSYNQKPKAQIPFSSQLPATLPESKDKTSMVDTSTMASTKDYTSLIHLATNFQMNKIAATTSIDGLEIVSKPVFDLDSVHKRQQGNHPKYISASSKVVPSEPSDQSHIDFVSFLVPSDRPLLPIEKLLKIT